MAKKGTYYGPFFSNFTTRIHGTHIRFGILIGTEADGGQRDVVFAAPTPPLPCGEPQDDKPPPPKDVVALLKSKGDMPFTEWAAQHIAAIQKLLPGGFEPCGCFAVVGEAAAKDLAPLLVPVLADIADPLVLTIDPASRKLSFWQHSAGVKPALRPANMKDDKYKDAVLLWAAVPVDIVVPCTSGKPTGTQVDVLVDDVKGGFATMLDGCTFGVAIADNEPLCLVNFESEVAISTVASKECSELRLKFLHSGGLTATVPNPKGLPCLRQRCLIISTAVVLRRNVELRHAVKLLRKALVASAVHRLQLALDEATEEGAEGAKGILQLPFRALCQPEDLQLPLWCGDYCMPDEEKSVARERLGQLLGLQESSLEEAPEHLDEFARLDRDYKGTYGPPSQAHAAASVQPGGGKSVACPLVVGATAVVALLVALAVPTLRQLS